MTHQSAHVKARKRQRQLLLLLWRGENSHFRVPARQRLADLCPHMAVFAEVIWPGIVALISSKDDNKGAVIARPPITVKFGQAEMEVSSGLGHRSCLNRIKFRTWFLLGAQSYNHQFLSPCHCLRSTSIKPAPDYIFDDTVNDMITCVGDALSPSKAALNFILGKKGIHKVQNVSPVSQEGGEWSSLQFI